MDTQIFRELVERLNGQYRAAMDSAYCPSSEAHNQQIKAVRETNAAIEAYLAAVDSVTLMTPNRRGKRPSGVAAKVALDRPVGRHFMEKNDARPNDPCRGGKQDC